MESNQDRKIVEPQTAPNVQPVALENQKQSYSSKINQITQTASSSPGQITVRNHPENEPGESRTMKHRKIVQRQTAPKVHPLAPENQQKSKLKSFIQTDSSSPGQITVPEQTRNRHENEPGKFKAIRHRKIVLPQTAPNVHPLSESLKFQSTIQTASSSPGQITVPEQTRNQHEHETGKLRAIRHQKIVQPQTAPNVQPVAPENRERSDSSKLQSNMQTASSSPGQITVLEQTINQHETEPGSALSPTSKLPSKKLSLHHIHHIQCRPLSSQIIRLEVIIYAQNIIELEALIKIIEDLLATSSPREWWGWKTLFGAKESRVALAANATTIFYFWVGTIFYFLEAFKYPSLLQPPYQVRGHHLGLPGLQESSGGGGLIPGFPQFPGYLGPGNHPARPLFTPR
ncbi:OLC1v1010036C1 [Oldenlandia corymbosa var. corymbosa]|uniref:OLC1v1010036C1 n=1 Tax=Oldenlandia corymbosa var. corymbosa TaxID=529605 RepID=A0AAV1DRY0_OLDCO|nr:OLC1v1010036C1 [Oldenlandia corymbosa var. corymbosa]